MLERAREAAIECTVFDAVDGMQLDAAWLGAHRYAPYPKWRIAGHPSRFFQRELKWGEVGCAISHLRVWEECARRADCGGEVRPTLVLEDDVVFPPDFAAFLERLLGVLARGSSERTMDPPDFVYLFSKPIGKLARGEASRELPIDGEHRLVLNPPPSWKMGAYLLFPDGARKLARSAFRSNLVPVDDFLPAFATGHPLRPDLTALFGPAAPAVGAAGAAAGGPAPPGRRGQNGVEPGALEPKRNAFTAYAVCPSPIAERKMSMSDTENSAELPVGL